MYGSTPMSISGLRAPVMSHNPKQPLLPRSHPSKHALHKLPKLKTQIITTIVVLPDSPSPTPPHRSSTPHQEEPDLETGLYQPNPPPSPPEERTLMLGYGTMRQLVSRSDEARVRLEEMESAKAREREERKNREYECAVLGELVFRAVAVVLFSAYFVFLGWKVWEGWEKW